MRKSHKYSFSSCWFIGSSGVWLKQICAGLGYILINTEGEAILPDFAIGGLESVLLSFYGPQCYFFWVGSWLMWGCAVPKGFVRRQSGDPVRTTPVALSIASVHLSCKKCWIMLVLGMCQICPEFVTHEGMWHFPVFRHIQPDVQGFKIKYPVMALI